MSIYRLQQYHHLIEGQVLFGGLNEKWHIKIRHFQSKLN